MATPSQRPPARGALLVLGATGIIGRELVAAAARSGFDVVGISRHPHPSSDPHIRLLAVDGYNTAAVLAALDGTHFVAAIDLLSFNASQLQATVRSIAAYCDQYFFVSSATIYESAPQDRPISEDYPRIHSGWDYPLKKIDCEATLQAIAGELGIVHTIVRPYITYSSKRVPFGPWESDVVLARLEAGRPIPLAQAISTTPTSLTDSRDLARAILSLVGNPAAANEDFIVASAETLSWAEAYSIAGDALAAPPWLVPVPETKLVEHFPELSGKVGDRLRSRRFNPAKLLAACPGFTFEHSVRDGLSAAIGARRSGRNWDPAPRYDGRIDRLIWSQDAAQPLEAERRRYRNDLRRQSLPSSLRYEVGFHPALNKFGLLFDRSRSAIQRLIDHR